MMNDFMKIMARKTASVLMLLLVIFQLAMSPIAFADSVIIKFPSFADFVADSTNTYGIPLIDAATDNDNDVSELKRLIAEGADVNVKTKDGSTALMIIASFPFKRDGAVKILLDAGADVNATDEDGRTALMKAAFPSSLFAADLAKTFLDAGANVNATDEDGQTALMHAAWRGSKDVAKILLDADADINAVDDNGDTALITVLKLAVATETKVVDGVIMQNSDASLKDGETKEEFMLRTFMGHPRVETAKILLDAGADVNVKNDEGKTALDLATPKVIDLIKEHLPK